MAKPINLEVKIKTGESFERAAKRFSRKIKKEKILEEYINKQRYEKPSEKRNKKKRSIKRKRKQELAEQKEKERSIVRGTNYSVKKRKR
tara:strand:+ start:219 stop:485 length:267 start_codon:yes stop_codon:yes gene_type:complete